MTGAIRRLADLFGRRRLLIVTAIIFGVGAIVCAASDVHPWKRCFHAAWYDLGRPRSHSGAGKRHRKNCEQPTKEDSL
jgi:hypothetical protein